MRWFQNPLDGAWASDYLLPPRVPISRGRPKK
jgi:hypothetical protein